MTTPTQQEQVVAATIRMAESRFTSGTSGNISVRTEDGLLITPSALPYEELTAADIVAVGSDGSSSASRRPSTEWSMHLAIYQAREDVGAIVHAHSPFCTALACVRQSIPAFHYMVAVAGGVDIRCAEYETFGTEALAVAAVRALSGRFACLLANHGMLALAGTPAAALSLAYEVEALAEQYWRAKQIGDPVLLDDRQMAEVSGRFASYRGNREYNLGQRAAEFAK